jgi:hypothetical protein
MDVRAAVEWRATNGLPAGSAGIARLAARIEASAVVLSAEAAERGITITAARKPAGRSRAPRREVADHLAWFESVVWSSRLRLVEVKAALEAFGRVERPGDAEARVVRYLADLTPLRVQLVRLSRKDLRRAMEETARQLDALDVHLASAAALLGDPGPAGAADEGAGGAGGAGEAPEDDAAAFERISADLLDRGGGGMSLREAAGALGTSKQALHKRIHAGTALGMMRGREIVVPRVQFAEEGGKVVGFLPGIAEVLATFREAGERGWGALQFLVEQDPNLGRAPVQALREGRVEAVVQAARAYLGLDEG